MITVSPCACPPFFSGGKEITAARAVKVSNERYSKLYVQYKGRAGWHLLQLGASLMTSLQQARDINPDIVLNSGSFNNAHFYLKSTDGNNMTTGYFTNAQGGGIQTGNSAGFAPLNLQPLGGMLTYGGKEVADKDWVLSQLTDTPNIGNTDLTLTGARMLNGNNRPLYLGTNPSGLSTLLVHAKSYVDIYTPRIYLNNEAGNVYMSLTINNIKGTGTNQHFQNYSGELEVLQTGTPYIEAIDGSSATLLQGTRKYGLIEFVRNTATSSELWVSVLYDQPFDKGSVPVCSFSFPEGDTFLDGKNPSYAIVPLTLADPYLKTGFGVAFYDNLLPSYPPHTIHIRYLVNGH